MKRRPTSSHRSVYCSDRRIPDLSESFESRGAIDCLLRSSGKDGLMGINVPINSALCGLFPAR
jgi:hypothetical protein